MSEPVGPAHPDILEEEIDDEVLLLDPRSGKYFSLNPTAADVWRLADGEMTAEQVVATLAVAYEMEPAEVREEITQVIESFTEAGLFDPADTEA